MHVLNFGSINIDHVYRVPRFVAPGETLATTHYQRFLGGKGANQSLALARAGAKVSHVGAADRNSEWALTYLYDAGVDTVHVAVGDTPTGHAVIQVNDSGENCILIAAGANETLTADTLQQAMAANGDAEWLVLQNETANVVEAARDAAAAGLKVAFNPAPFDAQKTAEVIPHCHVLVVNDAEFDELAKSTPADALTHLDLIITHGAQGAELRSDGEQYFVPARKVDVVDTTAAGDTFIGYYVASRVQQLDPISALERAAAAAALCVSVAGAGVSIPTAQDVDRFMET